MVKHYCDRCGVELEDREMYKIKMSVSNLGAYGILQECCKACMEKVVGATTLDEIRKKQEEAEKRKADRLAAYRAEHEKIKVEPKKEDGQA